MVVAFASLVCVEMTHANCWYKNTLSSREEPDVSVVIMRWGLPKGGGNGREDVIIGQIVAAGYQDVTLIFEGIGTEGKKIQMTLDVAVQRYIYDQNETHSYCISCSRDRNIGRRTIRETKRGIMAKEALIGQGCYFQTRVPRDPNLNKLRLVDVKDGETSLRYFVKFNISPDLVRSGLAVPIAQNVTVHTIPSPIIEIISENETDAPEATPRQPQPRMNADETARQQQVQVPAADDAQITKNTLPPNSVYLAMLQETSATEGLTVFGEDDKAWTVNNQPVPNALFASAPSRIVYDIGGQSMKTLEGSVGIANVNHNSSSKFAVYGDHKLLWESKTIKEDPNRKGYSLTENFKVSVASVKKLVLEVEGSGDRNSDHNVWIDPVLKGDAQASGRSGIDAKVGDSPVTVTRLSPLTKTASPPNSIYLANLQEMSATVGAYKFLKGDKTWTVNNNSMPNALFASAPSRIVYDIGGQSMKTLEGSVGVARVNLNSSCKFMIYGNGKLLWESKTIREDPNRKGYSLTENFKVSVASVKELVLEVDDLGDRNSDHSVWIDPVLTRGELQASGRSGVDAKAGVSPLTKPASLPNSIYLTQLQETSAKVGFYSLLKGDKTWAVNNNSMPNALFAHAPSRIVYDIDGQSMKTLEGSVGVARVTSYSSCKFKIYGDDKLLWTSKTITEDPKRKGSSLTENFKVSVVFVKKLVLEVDDLGSQHSDHSVWIDPILRR